MTDTEIIALEVGKDKPTSRTAFSPKLIGAIADEVSKALLSRLPSMMRRPKRKTKTKKTKKIEYAVLLDTSAIIDGRIFDVISTGLLSGNIVILPSILMELKHLADSQDAVKRERGRKGLELLEKLRKSKQMKIIALVAEDEKKFEDLEVDERLIRLAKVYKGKIITCDYNLEKKASVENVRAVNINALANYLKVIAVPGEALHILVSHPGKESTQGVGYMDDGTMIVVEHGVDLVGKRVDVVVSRVIQTATGKILFAKKI
jgi:uncharacterized protein YacL